MAALPYSAIMATTIQNRSRKVADNVLKNNALLARLAKGGRVKPFSGGNTIMQELSYAENTNANWYSGYDLLPVAAVDVISAAEYQIKQAACAVVISGLELLQNSGKEAFINLLESRVTVAEDTMTNLISAGVYSDGTGAGGKQIDGLDLLVPTNPLAGTAGGIDRPTWAFWRSIYLEPSSAITAASIQQSMNAVWAQLVRGGDRPDLIPMDGGIWQLYIASLQSQQRFTDPETAKLGFPTVKYMDADAVLDGGIGGFCPTNTAFFLNTKYLFYRPHSDRNMVPIAPNRRYAINQDAEVQLIGWAGNMAASGLKYQGRLHSK